SRSQPSRAAGKKKEPRPPGQALIETERLDPARGETGRKTVALCDAYFFLAFLVAFLAAFLAVFLAAFLAGFLAAFLVAFFAAFLVAISRASSIASGTIARSAPSSAAAAGRAAVVALVARAVANHDRSALVAGRRVRPDIDRELHAGAVGAPRRHGLAGLRLAAGQDDSRCLLLFGRQEPR